jgi:CcmD family protein
MSTGAQYVVAAYAVIWFVLLCYVVYVTSRTQRLARDVELLTKLIEPKGADQ